MMVLLGNLRSHLRGLLQLVLRDNLLPLRYITLLVGLIMFTKSMLALKVDRVKIGLKLFRRLR
jgi:hypothetical protein